jgi:LCP family protein required for cell wall assembly
MATQATTTPPRSWVRRFFGVIFLRLIPLLLVIAILWTGVQVVGVFMSQYTQYQTIEGRREAYSATATAIATAGMSAEQQSNFIPHQSAIRLVQFATNTPDQAQVIVTPPGALPTNTPAPTLPSATQPPAAGPATEIPKPTIIVPNDIPAIAEDAGTAVPTKVPLIPRNFELVNIVLLGSDEEVTADTTIRTDVMVVISINTQTRTVAMMSLPRDLFIYNPAPPSMQRLNTIFGIGRVNGWDDGGFELLRQVIFYNFGINVHYYAKVNFSGFENIINELGGVEVAVDCEYTDYYPVENIDPSRPLEENYYLRTLPVGYYTLSGFDALWYARTRRGTDDFDRGDRQQRMLRAIFRKALTSGQLARLPELWGDFQQVVETNLPFEVMLGLLPIGLNLNPDTVESFRFIRTYHTTPWQPTSGAYTGQAVQLPNHDAIQQLLVDFYTPPTESQLDKSEPLILVYNGTTNPDWDKVAAGRLRDEGFNAVAMGPADNTAYADTLVIDQIGEEKGSLNDEIADELNITAANQQIAADVNRQADYRVIVGASYNSCRAAGLGN